MDIKTVLNGHTDDPLKHAAGLSAVWQKCMSLLSAPDYKMLTPKEHGQLKRLKDSLGVERATQMIEYAIQNWETFSRNATQSAQIQVFPSKPDIGFLLKYHATALILMLDEKKKAGEEQAMKEAQAKVAEKAMLESKSKPNPVTPIRLTQEQLHAYIYVLDDAVNEAWVDSVTEKYGEWRPANPGEYGILCDIELKKAG